MELLTVLIFRYDGLWIDMNEPSNFVTGDMEAGCADTSTNYPPYYPGIRHQVICIISSRMLMEQTTRAVWVVSTGWLTRVCAATLCTPWAATTTCTPCSAGRSPSPPWPG